jgi:hypothetical protein
MSALFVLTWWILAIAVFGIDFWILVSDVRGRRGL